MTFLDEDGTEISSADYDYGTPVADIVLPADPTKEATAQFTFSFAGWDPEIAPVTEDATYTATYDAQAIAAPAPAFKTQSLVLSGEIGVNFYLDLPELDGVDYADSYMTFTVGNSETEALDPYDPNQRNKSGTYFGFTCYVNSIQMADTIHAVFHYTQGGEEKTVEKDYSVERYLISSIEDENISAKELALIESLASYGYYAQKYLSELRGWTLDGADGKYAAMNDRFLSDYDLTVIEEATEAYRMDKEINEDDVNAITFSLSLDSNTVINLYVKPQEGYTGSISATLDGAPVSAVQQTDGRYRIRISGISAHLLSNSYTVVITTDSGASTVTVSALSFVYACLSAPLSEAENNAVAALYQYSVAADAYKNP